MKQFKAWDRDREQFFTSKKWVEFRHLDSGEMIAVNFDRSGKEQQLDIIQSTGAIDFKFNVIYDKDILQAEGDSFYGVVFYHEDKYQWHCNVYHNGNVVKQMPLDEFINSRHKACMSCVNIVGNYFENKDLVEANK